MSICTYLQKKYLNNNRLNTGKSLKFNCRLHIKGSVSKILKYIILKFDITVGEGERQEKESRYLVKNIYSDVLNRTIYLFQMDKELYSTSVNNHSRRVTASVMIFHSKESRKCQSVQCIVYLCVISLMQIFK